jgi:quinol monooxygenase YgiN
VLRRYKSRAVFDRHFAAPEYAEFQATLKAEDIINFKDPVDAEIRTVEHVAGFV